MKLNHHLLALVALCTLLVVSCEPKKQEEKTEETQAVAETEAQETSHEKKHWNYEGETGPEHWAEIEENDCGGQYQSPIDVFGAEADKSLKPIEIHYSSETKIHDVINNGHSIQYNFEPGDYIVLDGEKYELKQFHFHESAEHTIKGIRYPLVIHMVHMSEDGKYAVLAVMAEESNSNDKAFDFLESFLPVNVKETKEVNASFNMNDALPTEKQYYTYTGSLTTPPCTEGVKWFIFKQPIDVSLKMIKELQGLMPINNFRNIQPLNGRVIKESM